MRGTMYTQELIERYIHGGYWDKTTRADLIDRNGERVPAVEALVDRKYRLTWGELSELSDNIALNLLELGYERDDVLLAELPNWAELYLVFVACEKAGIVLSGTQPTFREAELEPILRHIKAKGLIIPDVFRGFNYVEMAERLRSSIPTLKQVIVVGDSPPRGTISFHELMKRSKTGKFTKVDLQNTRFDAFEIVNVTTTSGSTGIPKWIESPLCSRFCGARNVGTRWSVGPEDKIGAFYNIVGGGASTMVQFVAPLAGAKSVLVDQFDPREACELIQKEKITIACIVPPLMARLMDFPHLGNYDFGSLRLLHNSAQVLPLELGKRAEEKFGARYVQTYGTTEAAFSAISTYSPDDAQDVRLATIGRPYYEHTFKIVGEDGEEVPRGEIGEVCIGGPCCASGFYMNPALNDLNWKSGWFATGNLGSFDEQGNVVLLGRKRETIIRGGQNILPIEIENVLMEHPKVRDAAVVRMPDKEMFEKVCAYVVPREGQQLTFEEMIEFLKSKKLAPFKFPERLEVISEMPMVPAGQKTDKIKLEKDIEQKLVDEGNSTG